MTRLADTGKVVFGATVDLEDEDDGKASRYQIVGEDEADIKQGLISITSPIARALIGKSEGDVVVVVVPGGEKQLSKSSRRRVPSEAARAARSPAATVPADRVGRARATLPILVTSVGAGLVPRSAAMACRARSGRRRALAP